jgi:hypothetical protein
LARMRTRLTVIDSVRVTTHEAFRVDRQDIDGRDISRAHECPKAVETHWRESVIYICIPLGAMPSRCSSKAKGRLFSDSAAVGVVPPVEGSLRSDNVRG